MMSKYILMTPMVFAFDFTSQPDCAVPCLKKAIAKLNCDLNLQCICPKPMQEAIRMEAMKCVLAACGSSDVAKAQKAAADCCATFSVETHLATTVGTLLSTSTMGAAAAGPSTAFVGAILAIAAL
ncbi:hypothetical protein H634G_11383 [Metarhizium anisopliae BRIP 53293]|uniref:CFEM domain-containing protein n=1 Tax=Metarhizium anisopliae BRIP 53293 TaxID=1291518 RepID=A0A0D9NLA5_METAN|nr:hypothetical protein H634G_11383 [Metarhizium anisopliae BRIP 53293]